MAAEFTASRITSPFGAESTVAEVIRGVSLKGRTAIVTGASSGIGIETARALASAGATVTLAVRDVAAGRSVADDINQSVGGNRASVEMLELASLTSVRTFAERWGDRPVHFLILNAGVMGTPFGRTADGFETQFGINHLGHFLLTNLLTEKLIAAAPSRVVVLSSSGHQMSDIHFDDLNYERRPYQPFEAYGQSKTANVLFAVGFTRRYAKYGVVANAVMPGAVRSNLGRYVDQEMMQKLGWFDEQGNVPGVLFKTPEQGAATSIWAAVAPELGKRGGLYLEDCQEAPRWREEVALVGVKDYALDPEAADRLWAASEALVGIDRGMESAAEASDT